MLTSDPRYKYLPSIVNTGQLQSFRQIFDVVPMSVIASDLGHNYGRFRRKVFNPMSFTFDDIGRLSSVTGLPWNSLCELVRYDIEGFKSNNSDARNRPDNSI
jgi:hypothetical protein